MSKSLPAKWPGFINLCTHQGCLVDQVFQIFWVQIKGVPLKFESEESATSLKSQRSLLKSGQVNYKLRFWNLIAVFTCLLTCCLNQWSIARSIYISFRYFFIWPSATLGYWYNCFILYNHPVWQAISNTYILAINTYVFLTKIIRISINWYVFNQHVRISKYVHIRFKLVPVCSESARI